jgi:hypothetical protein
MASHRQPVDLPATVRVAGGEPSGWVCRLRGLSLGDAFVELGALPMHTEVTLSFDLPLLDERLSINAVVSWSTSDGVCVMFDGLRAREVWVLWRYLEQLAAAPTHVDPEQDDTVPWRLPDLASDANNC